MHNTKLCVSSFQDESGVSADHLKTKATPTQTTKTNGHLYHKGAGLRVGVVKSYASQSSNKTRLPLLIKGAVI